MSFEVINDMKIYQGILDITDASIFYHQPAYLNFAAEMLDCQYEIHAWVVNSKVEAVCPWLVKDGGLGKVYNSLAYYGANGGVLTSSNIDLLPFYKAMQSFLKANSICYSYISNPFKELLLPNMELTQNRVAQVTSLPDQIDENILMEVFHSKTRNMIRKGLKENLKIVKVSETSFLEQTHKQNMIAVSVAYKEAAFFSNLGNYFKEGKDFQIFEALVDDVKAAAVLVFYHKETVEYYMPAVHIDYRNRQVMSALIFRVMHDSISRGCKYWNWGGTPISNENLHRFKERFGGIDKPYTIQTKVVDKKLLKHTQEKVVNAYPGMFVVPFNLLAK